MTKTQTFGPAYGTRFLWSLSKPDRTGEEVFLMVCEQIRNGADFNTAVGRVAQETGIAYGTVTQIFVDVEEGR